MSRQFLARAAVLGYVLIGLGLEPSPAAERHPQSPQAAGPSPAAADSMRPMPRADRNSRTAHEQLLEKAKKGRIDVYFVGDSITRRWVRHRLSRLSGQLEEELSRLERRQLRLGRGHHPEHPLAAPQLRAGQGEPEGHRRHGRHQQHRDHRARRRRRGQGRRHRHGAQGRPRRVPAESPRRGYHPHGYHPPQRQPRRHDDHHQGERAGRGSPTARKFAM